MTNQIISIATEVTSMDLLNAHIAKTLARYNDTKHMNLVYSEPKEDDKGFVVPMTLSQLVKRDQDARGLSNEGAPAKKVRKTEFDAVKAIFINEGINDLIEALLRYLGYQNRFAGYSKSGVATFQMLPKWKQNDVVGKKSTALAIETKTIALERREEVLLAREAAYQKALPADKVREIEATFVLAE
jgi:hypothetical protein